MSDSETWIRVAAVGAATGGRSFTPLAMESWAAAHGRLSLGNGVLAPLSNRNVARLVALSAVGELVADKTSLVPSRTTPGPFAGRLAFGALAGCVIATAERRPALAGAAIGAVAAGLSTALATHLRQSLVGMGLPDPLVALGEDLVVLAVSRAATR